MLIDFKSMLNKLATPRTGTTVVKLTTASNVGLYVQSRNAESKVIKLHEDNYVFHIQPGDVILQGSYIRGSKIHVIENLTDLKPNYQIVQLDGSGVFYPLLDIPSNYRKRPIDDSLNVISKVFLSLINGWDFSSVEGFDCNPLCDVRIRLAKNVEAYANFKAQRGYKEIIDQPDYKLLMTLNHHTGIADIVVWQIECPSHKDTKIDLAPGIFINIVNDQAKLTFDTDVVLFGPMVLEQITTPFKRDEEDPANVTKDAESVKLD